MFRLFARLPHLVAFLWMSAFAIGTPPTAEQDAKIVGTWKISPPDMERVYEITAGRNIKIMGGKTKEKFAHLSPQSDGSYSMILEGGHIQRIVFVLADDQLVVEHFNSRKDLELGLAAWKRTATRFAVKK